MKPIFLLFFLTILWFFSCSKPKTDQEGTPPPHPAKVPTLLTDSISTLTVFSVVVGGKIIDTGDSKLTEQGIVVGYKSGPTITANLNKFKLQVDSSGRFNLTIVGIPPDTIFYIRAYGVNAQGVGYGNEVKLKSFPENVFNGWSPTLRSQQEVNSFGARQYTTILNGLEITGTDITDLSPLNSIVIIGGGLNIKHTSLQNLKGLDSLEIIGNNFFNTSSFENNSKLKDLTGLNNVKFIKGYLQFARNDEMINFNGLNNVTYLHGSGLGVYDCKNLQNLNGLEKLTLLDGDLDLHRNPALVDLKGIRNLETITRSVRISGCTALPNLDGLEKLKKIEIISLENNTSLTNLNGFQNITTLSGLNVDNNEQLHDLSAMRNLKTIEYLSIIRSAGVRNLMGFSNLESITGKLTLTFNPNLAELKGLEKMRNGRTIEIAFNQSLPNLKGLDSLKSLKGSSYSLTISGNPSLVSLTGLEGLSTAEGQVYLENNSAQLNFCALKPFLLQYTGNSFILKMNGNSVTASQIISICP